MQINTSGFTTSNAVNKIIQLQNPDNNNTPHGSVNKAINRAIPLLRQKNAKIPDGVFIKTEWRGKYLKMDNADFTPGVYILDFPN